MTEPRKRITEREIAVERLSESEIAELAGTVHAPQSLHQHIHAMVDEAERRSSNRQRHSNRRHVGWTMPVPRIAVAAAAACVLAAAAIVAGLSGGGSSLTVQRAAALTLSRATMPAPRESAANRAELQMAVEGVAFPYWRDRYGWRSAGARIDRVAGRSVTTVFYVDPSNRSIGYAIASGRSPKIAGGMVKWRGDVPYHVLQQSGATVVAWPRRGHLCVVSGRRVDAATLLRLAGWARPAPGRSASA